MTINAQIPVNRHIASGSNTEFPYTFRVRENSDITVLLNGSEQTEGAEYDVVNQTLDGGTISFYVAPFLQAQIVIYRRTPVDQNTDYDPYDPFPAETHEAALDKLTMIAQENRALGITSLPLSISGLFWDAKGLRIQNGADPIAPDHFATKRYVDSRTDSFIPQDWDPDLDWNTTGNWVNSGNWNFTGDLNYNGSQVATVDQIPDISGKADKTIQILSAVPNEITISNPTLADNVTISTRTNIANGLAKLDGSGLIPPALLPFGQLENLGGYDPALGTPAAADAGQFYLFTADGTITLKDPDGVDFAAAVTTGDRMIWLDNPIPGWYYVAQAGAPGVASQIFYDNTQVPAARQLTAEDVQAALDEILVEYARLGPAEAPSGAWNFTGTRPQHQGVDLATVNDTPDLSAYTQRAVNEVVTGQWEFSVGLRLVGSRWPAGVGTTGQVLVTDGAGQLSWQDDDSGSAGMDPTQDYTISGDWNFIGGFTKNGDEVASLVEVDAAVAAGIGAIDFTPYAQKAAAETISGAWTFTGIPAFNGAGGGSALTISNNSYISAKNSVNGNTPILGLTSTNVTAVGNVAYQTNLTNNGDLRLNNALLNAPNGLVQVGASGKIPPSLNAFSSLEFIGTWDASGGTNPPNGPAAPADGGQFYVINVAGTLTIFVDDSGTPVATAVEPGDYLLWISGANSSLTPGYYLVTRETPTFIDAANVTFNNAGTDLASTTAQAAFVELDSRATYKDRAEAIAGAWTFNGAVTLNSVTFNAALNVPNTSTILNSSNAAMLGFNAIGNASRAWRAGVGGSANDDFILYNDLSATSIFTVNAVTNATVWSTAMTFSTVVKGAAGVATNDFVTKAQLDALPGFNPASDQTITGNWTFTQPVTFNVGRFAVLQQFNETTDGVVFEHVTKANGSARVMNLRGTMKKVAFRNPGFGTTQVTPYTITQNDEGDMISIAGNVPITVDSLQQFTCVRLVISSGVSPTLVEGTGNIRWHDGSGEVKTGDRQLAGGSIVELWWQTTANVVIFGNGIS